jgi:hypothetical protein
MENEIMDSSGSTPVGDALIYCYINEIPPFIEDGLENLYETLHSSLPFFRVFRSIEDVSCYVVRRDEIPSIILLFTFKNRRVEVLNEMIELDQAEVYRFTRYIFSQFPQVDMIRFKAAKTTTCKFGFPLQRYNSKDTYVVTLPGTPEEYTAGIGKSTRKDIRSHKNSILRDFPSYESNFYVNEGIDEMHIREIIKFSESRIAAKGLKISHDAERIIHMARTCGFVNVATIDGRVCAGSVNYRVGSSYFAEIIGFDTRYEKYGLGILCAYQTLCESIVRGGKRFSLAGGTFDYKRRLLALPLEMDELQIYRSYSKMIVNLDRTIQVMLVGYIRRLKKMLHQRNEKAYVRFLIKCFYMLKNKLKSG